MGKCFAAVGLVAAMLSAAGCSKSTIQIDGSSTVYPITEAVVEEFRNEQPGIRLTIGFSGTGAGFKKFAAGEIDISNASRPIKDSEREACKANGVEFVEFVVAFDGLSVIVNPENDWCDCLTVEQLKQLWQPESTVNTWSDLNPEWPNEKIQLYGPGTDSGTFDYFTEVIVGEVKKSRSDYGPSEDDNVLVTGIAGNKHALGYFGYAYYEENKERLKLLGVDNGDGNCVQPSLETVRGNQYTPLSRPLFVYVSKKSLRRPEVQSFVKFCVANAIKLSAEVGYVPVPEETDATNRTRLEEALAEVNPTT